MDYAIYANLANLVWAAIAVLFLFIVLRCFDRLLGAKFADHVWPVIGSDPLAAALYFGLRFLAVAYLMGAIVSQ